MKIWGDLTDVKIVGKIVKVHDGDTVHIVAPVGEAGGEYLIKARLYGIDTPELKVNKSAKAALQKIVDDIGGVVECHFGKKDKYGRILVTLFSGDENINQKMIDMGEAKAYFGGKKEAFFEETEKIENV